MSNDHKITTTQLITGATEALTSYLNKMGIGPGGIDFVLIISQPDASAGAFASSLEPSEVPARLVKVIDQIRGKDMVVDHLVFPDGRNKDTHLPC